MADSPERAIIFDFGGVFTQSEGVIAQLSGYDRLLGQPPGTLHATLYSGEAWEMASTGRLSREAYWQLAGARYEAALPAEYGALRRGLFHCEPINPAMIALAGRLHQHHPLALCSNALDDLQEVLESRADIRTLFDVVVISKVVGLRKPNPAILELTAERLGVPVGGCILIDDKARNTSVALSLGMDGIIFESVQQLTRTLIHRGLLAPDPAPDAGHLQRAQGQDAT
jgi:epoxide hydrolase-like predicted phosphatase